jgi:protein TonB
VGVFACRRHRLIWAAVAGIHLVALGAVWSGGGRPSAEPSPEGGLLLVSLAPDPVAVPGEAKEGVALGAGAPVTVPSPPVVATLVMAPAAPSTVSAEPTGAAAVASAPAPSALGAPAPTAVVFTEPAFLVRQEPVYPERARRAGAAGTAVVRVWLTPAGEVERVELAASSGHRLLDEAALAAAGASTFTPAARDRRPVAASAVATYRFELR